MLNQTSFHQFLRNRLNRQTTNIHIKYLTYSLSIIIQNKSLIFTNWITKLNPTTTPLLLTLHLSLSSHGSLNSRSSLRFCHNGKQTKHNRRWFTNLTIIIQHLKVRLDTYQIHTMIQKKIPHFKHNIRFSSYTTNLKTIHTLNYTIHIILYQWKHFIQTFSFLNRKLWTRFIILNYNNLIVIITIQMNLLHNTVSLLRNILIYSRTPAQNYHFFIHIITCFKLIIPQR